MMYVLWWVRVGKKARIYDKKRCSGRKTKCNCVGMHILSVVAEKRKELKEQVQLQMSSWKAEVHQRESQ